MEELKQCPFCGGAPKVVESEIGVPEAGKETYQYRHIECRDCGCRGSSFRIAQFGNSGFSYSAKWDVGEMRKMVRQWNRRVKIKEKAKPVWKPQIDEISARRIEFAFCPRCGVIINEMCIKGERMPEKYCKNCGIKFDYKEDEGARELR